MPKKTRAILQSYDMLLSFRGIDTRTSFINFLYISLEDAGFCIFKDNNALPTGEDIRSNLLQGIKNCKIAIPIISERYAQSKLRLCELAEIMDCHTKHHKSVFPIFYKVDVVDVLEQRGEFGKALREPKRYCSSKDVQKWESALTSVASIKGWTSQDTANGNEAELAKMVVEKVSSVLKTAWIKRLPFFRMLMSYHHIRSVYLYFTEKKRTEVFLAFHSPDTRCGFAAYLCNSLMDAGISVFRIDDLYLIGKNVSSEIRDAIDHCKISILILSKNFASSHWCHDELAQMIECKKTREQKMFPIFYKVEPLHVKDLSHSFGHYMGQQKKQKSKYKRWKEALEVVGGSSGLESEFFFDGREGEIVKEVVKEVSKMLMNPQTHDSHPHLLNIDLIMKLVKTRSSPILQEDFPRGSEVSSSILFIICINFLKIGDEFF